MSNNQPPSSPPPSRRMLPLLLAVAAAIAAVAVYVGFSDSHTADRPADWPARPTMEQEVRQKARGLIDSHMYGAAVRLLNSWRKGNPADVEALCLLAEAACRDDQYDAALAAADVALKLAPNHPQALWWKGKVLQRRGEHAQAMDLFRRAADSPAADARIWSAFGKELIAAGDPLLAEDYLRRAYEAHLRDTPTLGLLGGIAMQRGRFDQAARFFREALANGTDTLRLRVMLAEALKEGGQFDQAAGVLQAALLEADPADRPVLWMMFARVALLREQYAEAAEAFVRAAEDPALRREACLLAGRSYMQAGRYDDALKQVDALMAEPMPDPDAEVLRRQILAARDAASQPASAPGGLLLPPTSQPSADSDSPPLLPLP